MFLIVAVPPEAGVSGVDLMSWTYLSQKSVAVLLDSDFVRLSFLFILIGYGTKAGLAPMHTWLPDGHGEAPSPVSALLSGVMLKSALYAILRFYTITNLNLNVSLRPGSISFTSALLIGFGLISLIFATPFILKENRFKRVLAYHSLEHMGIIFFGLGIGTELALLAALLHALNHAITKALMFLTYGFIQYEYNDRLTELSDDQLQGDYITGVLQSMPVAATILAWGGLALVGSPPFNIFMSEFMILWAAISTFTLSSGPPYPAVVMGFAVGIFVITLTVIFGGLVNHMAHILLGKSHWPAGAKEQFRLRRYLPFFVLMFMVLLFGFMIPNWPIQFPRLLEVSTTILQQGASLP
jgi:hydrogenase-4 component F